MDRLLMLQTQPMKSAATKLERGRPPEDTVKGMLHSMHFAVRQ